MKICFIAHCTALYGANRSLLDLIDGLVSHGVEPYVIVPQEGDVTNALRERKIPVGIVPLHFWVGPPGVLALSGRLFKNLKAFPLLVKQLLVWQPDIIYTNSSVIPCGAAAAIFLRKPHIWHLREFPDINYGWKFDFGGKFSRWVIRESGTAIAVSESVKEYFCCHKEWTSVYVVYNGVQSEKIMDQLKERRREIDDECIFAIVGTLHPSKGQKSAIKATAIIAAKHPNIRLLVAGSGDFGPLKKFASEIGIYSKVDFLGHVDDPFPLYLRSRAVLMCSPCEAMGRVTAEAMAASRPVIGYQGGGTPEIIEDGVTGFLYDGSVEALAVCMQRFAEDRGLASKMGNAAWWAARRRFTVEAYAGSVLDVIAHSTWRKGPRIDSDRQKEL